VSEGLVSKIVKEGKVAEQTGTKVRTPGKSRKRSTGFIVVDDFDMGVIRRKQHEFYDDHTYCVSEGLVLKIVKEGKVVEQTGTKVRTPGKSRK
ncbi:Uncharacterized protein OBRU01_06876, partial [Operophtera brumata]